MEVIDYPEDCAEVEPPLACEEMPPDMDNWKVEDYVFQPLSLKQLTRRRIHDHGIDYKQIGADLTNFMLNEGSPIEPCPYTRESRDSIAASLLSVSSFPMHPMDCLKPILPWRFDIIGGAKRYLSLLQEIDMCAELANLAYVTESVWRYEAFLRLQHQHPGVVLRPPLDIAAVWLSHIIRVQVYRVNLTSLGFEDLHCQLLRPDFDQIALSFAETEKLWHKMNGSVPFEHSRGKCAVTTSSNISVQPCEVIKDRKWLSDFRSQTSGPMVKRDDEFFANLLCGYEMLLYLHAKFPLTCQTTPPVPIDLMWHTHMINTKFYPEDITTLLVRESTQGFYQEKGGPHRFDHSPWPDEAFYGREKPTDFQNEFDISMSAICADVRNLPEAKVSRFIKLQPKKCTARLTHRMTVRQQWFNCATCGLTEKTGCCEVCARECHSGHSVKRAGTVRAYCDCGIGGKCKSAN